MIAKDVTAALQKPDGARRLATVKEAARYAKCGVTRLYHLIAEEKIIAYKDGYTTLVDLDTIDDYHHSLPRFIGHRATRRRRR